MPLLPVNECSRHPTSPHRHKRVLTPPPKHTVQQTSRKRTHSNTICNRTHHSAPGWSFVCSSLQKELYHRHISSINRIHQRGQLLWRPSCIHRGSAPVFFCKHKHHSHINKNMRNHARAHTHTCIPLHVHMHVDTQIHTHMHASNHKGVRVCLDQARVGTQSCNPFGYTYSTEFATMHGAAWSAHNSTHTHTHTHAKQHSHPKPSGTCAGTPKATRSSDAQHAKHP